MQSALEGDVEASGRSAVSSFSVAKLQHSRNLEQQRAGGVQIIQKDRAAKYN
jgi:hypothetical protein